MVGGVSYFSGQRLSPLISPTFGAVANGERMREISLDFEKDAVAVAGSEPRVPKKKVVKTGKSSEPKVVKSSTGSVFSEAAAPVVVGDVPSGWKIETSNEIKAKFGPHKVPVGDDITFVVPVYTLVPDSGGEGVYVIEPGRTKEGHDEGGALGSVLARLDAEAQAVDGALGSLSKAIAMLSGGATTQTAKSSQPSVTPRVGGAPPQTLSSTGPSVGTVR